MSRRPPHAPHCSLPVPLRRIALLAGVLALLLPGALRAQTAAPAAPATGPVVVDGQAQVVEAFADPDRWIRDRLWVETEVDSDGDGRPDRVHVTVVRPEQTETEGLRVPVIYETSPYYAGTAQVHQILWDVRHELGEEPPSRGAQPHVPHQADREWISNSHVDTWVPRGFAVVHSDAPGTGLSHGCPTMGGMNESLAPKAVIDWLNGRARGFTTADGNEEVVAHWATGRVGMTGTSFNGTLPLAAATTGVEGLEAIIPIAPNTSYWHYYRSHGLVRSPGGYLGEDIDGLYDFVYSGPPERRDYCNTVVREETLLANMDRITGNWSDFWAERDYALQLDSLRAAVLMAHAWNDWNVMPEHSVRIIEVLQARSTPLQMYFHQGGHGGPPPLEMMNRWFTRWVLGVENGVEDEPRAWIVREGDDPMNPTPYPDFPNPRAAPVTLVPGSGGAGAGPLTPVVGGGSAVGAAPSRTPSGERARDLLETLVDDVSLSGADLARAQRSPHRLLYRTEELRSPLHLSGTPEISLRLSADRPAVNLSVWLVALPWEEPANRQPNFSVITRGWADPQNHRSLTESDPLVPGEFRDLTFTLQPTDQVVPPGKRVGLMVFSSDQEFTLWPAPGAQLTLDLSGVELVLPVVGGEEALLRSLGGPGNRGR
jgi:X-Pro dipeptidyl-peptidase